MMPKFISSPLVRISFGLVMLTVAMLFITDLLGLVPDTKNAELSSRKVIVESLAVQLSSETENRHLASVQEILRSVVERNETVVSAAVRSKDKLLVEYGDHESHWTLQPDDHSTPTEVQVPLFNEQGSWGTVEIKFTPLLDDGGLFLLHKSFTTVVMFMALAGFLVYLFFLKRTMRELNPDSVIPERVRKALDTLAEGLLIVDKDGFIVFSNQAFSRKIGILTKDLTGKRSAEFNWEMNAADGKISTLPWLDLLAGKPVPKGVTIKLKTDLKESYTFAVNASPITAAAGKIRGALVTFDDITEIEIKNDELQRTLDKLEESKREVTRQNQELQVLATRDPLTGVLNRRSLFQGFETLFSEVREEGDQLSCIMVDIDHFKSVNDRFGHSVGDKVIKLLAKILTENSRPNDLVGRFGGEEFCVILPGADIHFGLEIGERMRLAVQEGSGAKFTSALRITSSFGVAVLSENTTSPKELINQADKALYAAKEGGRNRVVPWSSDLEDEDQSDEIKVAQAMDVNHSDTRVATADREMAMGELGGSTEQLPAVDISTPTEQLITASHQAITVDVASDGQDQYPKASGLVSEKLSCVPNSVLLYDRIDQAIKRCLRHDTKIALLIVSIDALQRVIDTLGASVGEKITKAVISRIKQSLRFTDTVTLANKDELLFTISRLGRKEVVILLTDIQQNEIITCILQRIVSNLKVPAQVEGEEVFLNASIGVSVFPIDGEDPEILLRNASSAMREAEREPGMSKFQFYRDDINQRARKQIKLEAELHRAIERGELVVYYQPKVDLNNGNILGMEALVRWQHPQLGIVPPGEFIPLAEQTGLIEEIGRWVIQVACRQVRSWQEAGYGAVSVAVNLSPVEFRNPDLADEIIALVKEIDIPPSALELEITETVVMQSMDTAIATLRKISDAGLSISLDDFGTGYSSLSYLKRFPLNKVKIDRSFISDFMEGSNDAAIVSAIIAMSHSLGLRVVAEGVETDEQLRFLQDLHCDEMQGYLVSRPVPRDEASDLLARASGIKRMILDYGINFVELMEFQGPNLITGMAGVLNDFPTQVAGSQQDGHVPDGGIQRDNRQR